MFLRVTRMNSENSIPLFDFSDQETTRELPSGISEATLTPFARPSMQPIQKILLLPPPPINFEDTVLPLAPAEIPTRWAQNAFLPEKASLCAEENSSFSVHEFFENINKKKPHIISEEPESGLKREESSVMNPDTKIKQCTELPIFDEVTLPATIRVEMFKDKTPASSLSNSGKQARKMKSIPDTSFPNSFFRHAGDNIGGFGGGFGGLNDSLFGCGE